MCHKVLLQVVWPGVRRHSVPAETEVVTEAVTEAVLARQSGLHPAVAEIFNLHSAPAGDLELVLSTL